MPLAKIFATVAALGLSLAAPSAPAEAATAHNSQAGGAYRSTSNPCAPTAYFPADSGCLGSYLQRYQAGDDVALPRDVRERYRERPPLQ